MPPSKSELKKHALYWERIKRSRPSRGDISPIIYQLKAPLIFDCRFTTERRMGIGDQLCLVSAFQQVAERIRGGVSILYDAAYPGSKAVFKMSGLPCIQEEPAHGQLIPCRKHIFDAEDPFAPPYAEQTGCPIDQIFFNCGWQDQFSGAPLRLRLYPSHKSFRRALEIAKDQPYASASLLEISRNNNHCTPSVWSRLFQAHLNVKTIFFGCAPPERETLERFIGAMSLPEINVQIITEPLDVWTAMIINSQTHFTGNTSGLWLALGCRATPIILLQHNDPDHPHNTLWNYKTAWNHPNTRIFEPNLIGAGPFPPPRLTRSIASLRPSRAREGKT